MSVVVMEHLSRLFGVVCILSFHLAYSALFGWPLIGSWRLPLAFAAISVGSAIGMMITEALRDRALERAWMDEPEPSHRSRGAERSRSRRCASSAQAASSRHSISHSAPIGWCRTCATKAMARRVVDSPISGPRKPPRRQPPLSHV